MMCRAAINSNFSLSMTTNKVFFKRTSLTTRNSGHKFCTRFMRTTLRATVFESNQLSRQLYRNSPRILNCLDNKSKVPRFFYATRCEVNAFEKENKIKIRMTQSYDRRVHNHYCFQDEAKEGLDILTHWGKKNPIVCDGDIIGNPSFTEHKTRFQKYIENKCWTRALKKIEYKRLCIDKTKTTLEVIKIIKADPEAGRILQEFFAFCKKDTSMTRLEKNAFITTIVKDFLKNYKNK